MKIIAPVLLLVMAVLVGSARSQADPLKVYILAGQSNMQGHAQTKTLEHLGMNQDTAPLLKLIRSDDGTDRVFDEIWISSLGSSADIKQGKLTTGFGASGRGQQKIGPELMFGIAMHNHVKEPILIIKTAWGGKSLHTDFRSPSAGPYVFNEQELKRIREQKKDVDQLKSDRVKATGVYYRQMMEHVKSVLADIKKVYPDYDADQGYELEGFVWFQGWNDMVARDVYPNRDQPGGYDDYTKAMAHFIRDVRRDLGCADLPFVIGVMGTGGPIEKYGPEKQRHAAVHGEFRSAMAAAAKMPEFQSTVTAVKTEDSWDLQLTELADRKNRIRDLERKLKKDESVSEADRNEQLRELEQKLFTNEEHEILEKGVSNAEYHYLGSARILCLIGQSFADALAEMEK